MRVLLLLALLLPTVACDQFTKVLAVAHLKGAGTVHVVDGLFRLTYAENPGAFLGLGRHLPDLVRVPLFAAGALLCLGAALVYIARTRNVAPALFVAIALVVAGAVGNLVDRVARPGGRVVDFAQLTAPTPLGKVSTGIFNVADVYIVAGVALVIFGVRGRRSHPRDAEPAI